MSSLIVSHDLHIMMLEFVVEKIFVPSISVFDATILKKTIVKFRMLDIDWIELSPQRKDCMLYNGSSSEEENFHGGKSIVFAVPEAMLERNLANIDIMVHVHKEISRYFEMEPCHEVGSTQINIDPLFNGIIKDMKERKDMQGFFTFYHKREPISRSMKGTYPIINDIESSEFPSLTVYIRLSYCGKSIITEIERFPDAQFNIREETCGTCYQCLELEREELEGGCWGDTTLRPSINQQDLVCLCNKLDRDDIRGLTGPLDTGRSQAKMDQDGGGDKEGKDKLDRRKIERQGDEQDNLKKKEKEKGRGDDKKKDNDSADDDDGTKGKKKGGKKNKKQKGMKEGKDKNDSVIPVRMKKIKSRKVTERSEDDLGGIREPTERKSKSSSVERPKKESRRTLGSATTVKSRDQSKETPKTSTSTIVKKGNQQKRLPQSSATVGLPEKKPKACAEYQNPIPPCPTNCFEPSYCSCYDNCCRINYFPVYYNYEYQK